MFVSITTTSAEGPPVADAAAVAEEMERWLVDLEGFKGFLMLTQPGRALGLVFWESRELAERHGAIRAEFRERMLAIAGVTIESVEGYEIAYSHLDPQLIGGHHSAEPS